MSLLIQVRNLSSEQIRGLIIKKLPALHDHVFELCESAIAAYGKIKNPLPSKKPYTLLYLLTNIWEALDSEIDLKQSDIDDTIFALMQAYICKKSDIILTEIYSMNQFYQD